MIQKSLLSFFLVVLFAGFSSLAHADNHASSGGIIPNASDQKTTEVDIEPIIYMSADDTKIIRLDKDAVSVVVANPAHLNLLIDTPRLLIALPQQAGATSFTVLDSEGEIITKRHVVIGAPANKYVRIRRACNNAGTAPCQPTSVYFCPDGCHQVSGVTPETAEDANLEIGAPAGIPVSPAPDPEDLN